MADTALENASAVCDGRTIRATSTPLLATRVVPKNGKSFSAYRLLFEMRVSAATQAADTPLLISYA